MKPGMISGNYIYLTYILLKTLTFPTANGFRTLERGSQCCTAKGRKSIYLHYFLLHLALSLFSCLFFLCSGALFFPLRTSTKEQKSVCGHLWWRASFFCSSRNPFLNLFLQMKVICRIDMKHRHTIYIYIYAAWT
jgi:hypothetical protein